MPSFIIKQQIGDEDWYCEWSSIVDAPTAWGTRDRLSEHLRWRGWTGTAAKLLMRFRRADATGTSSLDGLYACNDDGDLTVMNGPHVPLDDDDEDGFSFYVLPRTNLRAYCEALDRYGTTGLNEAALALLRVERVEKEGNEDASATLETAT